MINKKKNEEQQIKVFKAMMDVENWKPNLSKISKDTGAPISTVHDLYKSNRLRLQHQIRIEELRDNISIALQEEGIELTLTEDINMLKKDIEKLRTRIVNLEGHAGRI